MGFLVLALGVVTGLTGAGTALAAEANAGTSGAGWRGLAVPGCWEDTGGIRHDGVAWYRCWVRVPMAWAGQGVTLAVEQVDNAHEAYFNGARIGSAGRFPPDYQSGLEAESRYVVPRESLKAGGWNLLAIRVYDHEGRGGFKGRAPQLGTDREHLSLEGLWQFRTGDDRAWLTDAAGGPAEGNPANPAGVGMFSTVVAGAVPVGSRGHAMAERGRPMSPAEAAGSFRVPADLEWEQVLAEPVVAQPVFLNFDERGRMWVVQYRQYPAPAGLKVVSKDVFWRAVYDRVPEPPPRGVKGLDRITIHEDVDGDGVYDRHKTFVDGLNIATACVTGRGGVWVLNPPYLLFYPDADADDRPDGDPEVRLAGFGLEDTHSVVNSLRWGPDGWLYAAQGSTVTGRVRRPGETNEVYSQGQNIWRYHPETRRYEIFSEGGGNAFGVELDNEGRIFSGHNGGDTRGFHYMQGAYLRKGFEKHGELGNPYAFGYFPQMTGTPGERFTHTFVIEAGGLLPSRYRGRLFGVEPLQGRIVLSELTPEGVTFVTRDLERVVTSADPWFRPVDIKSGPEGALYVADWYDRQVTHTRNQEGNIDASNGRIYRLKPRGWKPSPGAFGGGAGRGLGAWSSQRLATDGLGSSNQWVRQTALRLLGDRRDRSVVELLRRQVLGRTNGLALESLWALNQTLAGTGRTCGLPEEWALELLRHPSAAVRSWTARLLGDDGVVTPAVARALVQLAGGRGTAREDQEVRAQLASTARRLRAPEALPVIGALLGQAADADDGRLPLLVWWALEAKCGEDRERVLGLFAESATWFQPMVERHLLGRLMRRFAAAGRPEDLRACVRLFELSPGRAQSERLIQGFEEAFAGRSMAGLPRELVNAMARHGVGSEAFRVRQGDAPAVMSAVTNVTNARTPRAERLRLIEVFGEVRPTAALSLLIQLVAADRDAAVRKAALAALAGYDDPRIPALVVQGYGGWNAELRATALELMGSRPAWVRAMGAAVGAGAVRAEDIPLETVRRWQTLQSGVLPADLVARHWPRAGRPGSAEMKRQLERWSVVAKEGRGDPYAGQKQFQTLCASCHKLFARGGEVGPDLTSYPRTEVETLLLHVVNPSAEIREGYETVLVETRDDRSLTGFLVRRDDRVLVVRAVDGQVWTVGREDVLEVRGSGLSLMPEGLLDGLTEQQVRDLLAYLRSTQPLAN